MLTMRTRGPGAWLAFRLPRPAASRVGLLLLCLFLAAAGSLFAASSAHAEGEDTGPSAITISPTREKLALNPGESHDGSFEVFNSGNSPVEFRVYASPYQISDIDYENPDFETEAPRTQISRWVTLNSETVTLEANELAQIPYRIEVPSDVPAGGQYAALFVETQVTDEKDSSVTVKSRAGMLLYVTVNGDTREAGEITDEQMPWWQPNAPISGSTTVQNTGNTDFFVSSRFQVNTLFGSEKFEFSRQSPVLPETSRRITLEWPDSTPGIYQVTTTTTFLDEEQVTTRWVFVIPLGVLLGTIIGLALVVGILWLLRRSRKQKASRDIEVAVQEALDAEKAAAPEEKSP